MTTTTKRKNATLCLVLAAILLLSGCTAPQTEVPALLDTVVVAPASVEVTRGDVFAMDTVRANVVPETHELFFPIGGALGEVYCDLGDEVTEGDLLMKLDDTAVATRIENLENEIVSLKETNAANNRKIEIKIEKAELQLQALLDTQAAAAVTEDTASSEDSASSDDTSSSEDGEDNTPSDSTTSSGDTASSEQPPTATPEPTPTPTPKPAVDPYDIELKKLEIEGYELELSQAQESQALTLKDKNEQLAEYREQQLNYYLYAPSDGQVIWLAKATDPLTMAGSRVSAEAIVAIVADRSSVLLQTVRLDPLYLSRCEHLYAIIDGKEYDLTALENDAKEDATRSMEGKPLYTRFSANTEEDISTAGTAVICFKYNTAENVLTLPLGCTYYDTGNYVYRIHGDEREKVYVEIGMEGATCIEIVSGLEEGDLVYAKS